MTIMITMTVMQCNIGSTEVAKVDWYIVIGSIHQFATNQWPTTDYTRYDDWVELQNGKVVSWKAMSILVNLIIL